MRYEVVNTVEQFNAITASWGSLVALDTETYGNRWDNAHFRVLGISIATLDNPSSTANALYIPLNFFKDGLWKAPEQGGALCLALSSFIASRRLIGHNFTYDQTVLCTVGMESRWHADTRLMYHMSSAPAGPRPYSLKELQKEVLGWKESNKDEMAEHVKARGGSIKNGDHYLAAMEVIAKYACLDTMSTIQGYAKLAPFFERNEYWPMLHTMMQYNELLERNTVEGTLVDKLGLEKAHNRMLQLKQTAERKFRKVLTNEISELERDWVDRRASLYKRQYNKDRLLSHPEEWKKFNLNSDKDKRELFFDKLKFEALERTDGGKPSAGADSIRWNNHPVVEPYLIYEYANTITSNFSAPYIDASGDGRLHPGFNICGTVSYRLSGFKPYLLNAPFDEKRLLRNLQVPEGYIGVHADLSAIEPTITAHYSEDPSLLKVFGQGLGDIYLDLALELFPNDKELQNGYDPHIPISKEVKKRFERQRKVAKVIQLAVQYTGTGHTVSRNLTKDGIPTTVGQADGYVRAYWQKFKAVELFNQKLKVLNKKQGYLRNVVGRIIRVPDPDYKDLSNRFIQSGAHDVLVLWVLEIYKLCGEAGIEIRPVLLDCHDSTSNMCDYNNGPTVMKIYEEALENINKRLELSVKAKAESKFFSTLAGLKGE